MSAAAVQLAVRIGQPVDPVIGICEHWCIRAHEYQSYMLALQLYCVMTLVL